MTASATSPLTSADVDRMTERLFIRFGAGRARKWSAFWTLLVLAAVIAGLGIVADSTATVIGAMIVAPLMTPILGTALAIVLADRRQVLINVGLVLAGALVVVLIGWLLGVLDVRPVVAATNSQVAGRIRPGLADLLAALATGVVGAFAQVRSDVSDTLPGVAIAISLVPPLAVVGLTLESGAPGEASGALLLFATNVAAIIATGTAVLLAYRVRAAARAAGYPVGRLRGRTLVAVGGGVLLVAVPLALGSVVTVVKATVIDRATAVATEWAAAENWELSEIAYRDGALRVVVMGPPPEADTSALRRALDDKGLRFVDVRVTLVVASTRTLDGSR